MKTVTVSKWTGKPIDRNRYPLGRELKAKCDDHAEINLLADCIVCGAPVCCPQCCHETQAEHETANVT